MSGKLFIVGTPIGNLKDITLRAIDTLKECDLIAAEDTRITLKLLNHLQIKKTLISYHKHNEREKSGEIIKRLQQGENVALVSDAGMPGISDPGSVVMEKAVREGLDIEIIPGVTAVITALVYSSLDTSKFTFRGFFPRENKEREALYAEIKDYRETLMFYESPHRLVSMLGYLNLKIPNRKVALAKELTKLHETIYRGTVEEAYNHYKENIPKGEFVVVIEGKTDEIIRREKESTWENLSIKEHILKKIEEGFTKKEAIKKVAKDRNIAKSQVYKHSLEIE